MARYKNDRTAPALDSLLLGKALRYRVVKVWVGFDL